MIEAFFFGPASQQIFATYHPPVGGGGRSLTVICAPLFSEYMRSQLALRELSIALAASGQHVLRFDYRGTGDSSGELPEVAVADWIEDIQQALREGRELTGSDQVHIVGVRAGALLACRAVGARDEVRSVVLWDPVPDGTEYLRVLRRVQAAILHRNRYLSSGERAEALAEYGGYRLPKRMVEEFLRLGADAYAEVPVHKLHVVSTSHPAAFVVAGAAQHAARFECDWEAPTEDQLLPQPVLEKVTQCISLC
jgi:alpha-beta hydrolase superfamily lysophospholipase